MIILPPRELGHRRLLRTRQVRVVPVDVVLPLYLIPAALATSPDIGGGVGRFFFEAGETVQVVDDDVVNDEAIDGE